MLLVSGVDTCHIQLVHSSFGISGYVNKQDKWSCLSVCVDCIVFLVFCVGMQGSSQFISQHNPFAFGDLFYMLDSAVVKIQCLCVIYQCHQLFDGEYWQWWYDWLLWREAAGDTVLHHERLQVCSHSVFHPSSLPWGVGHLSPGPFELEYSLSWVWISDSPVYDSWFVITIGVPNHVILGWILDLHLSQKKRGQSCLPYACLYPLIVGLNLRSPLILIPAVSALLVGWISLKRGRERVASLRRAWILWLWVWISDPPDYGSLSASYPSIWASPVVII